MGFKWNMVEALSGSLVFISKPFAYISELNGLFYSHRKGEEKMTTCKWLMFAYNWRKRKWLSLGQTVNFFFIFTLFFSTSLCHRCLSPLMSHKMIDYAIFECKMTSELAQSNDEIDVIYLFLWTSAAGYHSSFFSSFIISCFIDANFFAHTLISHKHLNKLLILWGLMKMNWLGILIIQLLTFSMKISHNFAINATETNKWTNISSSKNHSFLLFNAMCPSKINLMTFITRTNEPSIHSSTG